MRRIALLLLLPLAACATGPSLQSRMAAYTGASAETLVHSLGVPDKQVTLKGVQYFAYSEHHTEIDPGIGYGFVPYYGAPYAGGGFFGGPIYSGNFGGFPPTVNEYSCETTFSLRDDKVFSYSLRGNDCS